MKTIVVNFDEAGNPSVEAKGFAGKVCKKETEFLEKALGAVTADVLTAEYNQKVEVRNVLHQ